MAAEACVVGYKTLIIKLDDGTEALLGKRKHMLSTEYDAIITALEALPSPVSLLIDWQQSTQGAAAEASARSVMKEHCKSVKSCAAFVQAALARMHSIDSEPTSHNDFQEAQDLFVIIFMAIQFTQLPSSWPNGWYLLHNLPLYNALNALAGCMLRRTLSFERIRDLPFMAAVVMTPALLLLQTTVMCLRSIEETVDGDALVALPSGLTNNLCCLAYNELGPHLSDDNSLFERRGAWGALFLLLNILTESLQNAQTPADSRRLCKVLLGPEVLEASKMVTLAHCSPAFQGLQGNQRL